MFVSILHFGELLSMFDMPFIFFVTDLEKYFHVIQKDFCVEEITAGEIIRDDNVKACLGGKKDVVDENLFLNGISVGLWISPIVINNNLVGCCGIYLKKANEISIFDGLSNLKLKMNDLNSQLEFILIQLENIKDRIKESEGGGR